MSQNIIVGQYHGSHPGLTPKQAISVRTGYIDIAQVEWMKKTSRATNNFFFPYLEIYEYRRNSKLPETGLLTDLGFAANENELLVIRVNDSFTYTESGEQKAKRRRLSDKTPGTDPGFPHVLPSLRGAYIPISDIEHTFNLPKESPREAIRAAFFEADAEIQRALIQKYYQVVGIALIQADLSNNNTQNGNSARGTLYRPDVTIQDTGTSTIRSGGNIEIPGNSKVIFKVPTPAEVLEKEELTQRSSVGPNVGISPDKILPMTCPLLPTDFISPAVVKHWFSKLHQKLSKYEGKTLGDLKQDKVFAMPGAFLNATELAVSTNEAFCIALLNFCLSLNFNSRVDEIDLNTVIDEQMMNSLQHIATDPSTSQLIISFGRCYQKLLSSIVGTSITHFDAYGEGDIFLHN